jgi:hypothetical protein
MGLFLSLVTLTLMGGVSYALPASHSLAPEKRLRRPLTALVSGLAGYVLFGVGLIPLEQVPFIAGAVQNWLPYEALPMVVSLLFAGAGLLLIRVIKR